MKKITIFLLACVVALTSCNHEMEQIFDRERAPVAPVLTIEGASTFIITPDLPDYFYTVLTWSRANFGKGVSVDYALFVSNNEEFYGNTKIIPLGADTYLRALSATELYGWAVDDYGVIINVEEGIKEPATLYFKIGAAPQGVSNPYLSSAVAWKVFSNVESIESKWYEDEPWDPVDITLYFKVISGEWEEYAVYGWGDAEVFGGWPGLVLQPNEEGWCSFTVPVNRPINLIINNNDNGKQFDFLKDPTEDLAFEFEISETDNSCVWTPVEIPDLWIPEDLDIYFKVLSSSGWDEFAVYAWGDAEVFGGWPGLTLEPNAEGWYSFTVPTNRPINLIINNGGNNAQFNFLTDPKESLAYEFEIGAGDNNCVWTVVAPPKGESALYMIGDEFGGWDWGSNGIVEMTPVNGFEGHFWAVRHISAEKGFKWCPVRAWSGDFYSIGEEIGYTVSGGNAYVAEDGIYMIYVDMENGKIAVEPAKVYGMGPCFGSWDTNMYPFEVNGQTMTRTTSGSGELRIYATSTIFPGGGDWWRMEFVVIEDKIAYRGNGGDQERVQVESGQLVRLDFNAGTGTIE
jgi:hypothetical protein